MNIRTTSLGLFATLFLFAPAYSLCQPDQGRPPTTLKVVSPGEGQAYRLAEPSVRLEIEVSNPRRLREISVEVLGGETGIFFTLCGAKDQSCNKAFRERSVNISLPVFEGENLVAVQGIEAEGNEISDSVRFHVSMADAEIPATFIKPMLQATEPQPLTHRARERHDTYDLLILTHKKPFQEDFVSALQPLVQHKNNTGMPTILLTLEEIYEAPALRGRDHPEIIKKAIADAAHRWKIKYVMLVGDSDRFPVRYTKIYDLGHWGHGFAPSDLYYADLFDSGGGFDAWDYDKDGLYGEMQGNFPANMADLNQDRINLVPDVAVGRVPATSRQELVNYVQKVIDYETTANASWFKKALLITGDYPGSNNTNDFVGTQLASRSFQLDKQYHDAVWPVTTGAQRWTILENALDAGVGFVSYVGHGAGAGSGKDGGLWGGWYPYDRIPFLNNQSRLPIIFSAACSTGLFHFGSGSYFAKWGFVYSNDLTPVNPNKYRWAPEPISFSPETYDKDSMAEHFLVKGLQGGIAFIGSYTGTQGGTHALAKYFFQAHASGMDVIGDAWNEAITNFVNTNIASLTYPGHSWRTAANYHHVHKMLLFGDPSLRMGGLLPNLVPKPNEYGNFCNVQDGKLLVTVSNGGSGLAAASTTEVDFFRHGKTSAPTTAISASQAQDLLFEIPAGCFDSDCNFRITVDAAADVAETSESDNTVEDRCVG